MAKSKRKLLAATNSKRILMVLWIPSADREGRTLPDQDEWKNRALELFGAVFGGATAMPRAEGVWSDPEAGGRLVKDFPILIHCYVTEDQASDPEALRKVNAFCRKMG
jgi:hypothetical protein